MNKNRVLHGLYWIIIKLSRGSKLFRLLIDWSALYFYKIFRSNKTFMFRSKDYKYFYHLYNRTVASERIIEIPIATKILDEYRGKNILEVGNVVSHYIPIVHEVLDKYEEVQAVINEDVTEFAPSKKYDLIISISTLKHVGHSYGEVKDANKFIRGVNNLQRLLVKDGLLFAAFPLYHNSGIDKLFKKNKMPFGLSYFMKRTSLLNDWKQITERDARKVIIYDSNYANANILYLGYFYKKK